MSGLSLGLCILGFVLSPDQPFFRTPAAMTILDIFPSLISAGAIGVAFLCLWSVVGLIKKEQERDAPSLDLLKTIHYTMGFGILLTVVAGVIEAGRYFKPSADQELVELKSAFEQLGVDGFYSTDRNGSPKAITVRLSDTTYVLSDSFPKADTPLELVPLADKFQAVKDIRGTKINFGYFNKSQLESLLPRVPTGPTKPSTFELESFFAAAIAYSPHIAQSAKVSLTPSENRAIKRLWAYLDNEGEDKDTRENAIRILVQPDLLGRLDTSDYSKLIRLLKYGNTREHTEANFDLAQVYYRRYQKYGNQYPEDMNNYKLSSLKYIKGFHERGWTAANIRQYAFYRIAVKAFYPDDVFGDCTTCVLTKRQLSVLSSTYDNLPQSS